MRLVGEASCGHCRVGVDDDLSTFDFASDRTPAKDIARRMIAMTSEINTTLDAIGEPADAGTPKITCFTCHRGATTPLTRPPGRAAWAEAGDQDRISAYDIGHR